MYFVRCRWEMGWRWLPPTTPLGVQLALWPVSNLAGLRGWGEAAYGHRPIAAYGPKKAWGLYFPSLTLALNPIRVSELAQALSLEPLGYKTLEPSCKSSQTGVEESGFQYRLSPAPNIRSLITMDCCPIRLCGLSHSFDSHLGTMTVHLTLSLSSWAAVPSL